jgi:hypothetical protein
MVRPSATPQETTMIRHPARCLLPVLAAVSLQLSACSDDSTTTGPPPDIITSDSPTTVSSDAPIDLMSIPDGTSLEPGTYSVGLLFDDGPTRALVDVPEGYVSHGQVISSDDGDIAFWGSVTRVDTDPCLGGKHVGAGTSVHDLAALLVAQRHMKISQPGPVTIGGYHGVHLALTAPADLDRCRGGLVTILAAGDTWLRSDVPNGIFHEWILNLRGTRVVGGARIGPDAANPAELIHMVESARFIGVDQP